MLFFPIGFLIYLENQVCGEHKLKIVSRVVLRHELHLLISQLWISKVLCALNKLVANKLHANSYYQLEAPVVKK